MTSCDTQMHASGRPKRAVSCSMMERQRLKKRRRQKVESDDSAGELAFPW